MGHADLNQGTRFDGATVGYLFDQLNIDGGLDAVDIGQLAESWSVFLQDMEHPTLS